MGPDRRRSGTAGAPRDPSRELRGVRTLGRNPVPFEQPRGASADTSDGPASAGGGLLDSLAGEETLIDTLCRWMRTGVDEPFAITARGMQAMEKALEHALKLPVMECAAQIEALLRMTVALDTELACPTLAARLWRWIRHDDRAVRAVRLGRSQERLFRSARRFARRWGEPVDGPRAPQLGQQAPAGSLKAAVLFDVGHQGSWRTPKVVRRALHPELGSASGGPERTGGGR